MMDSLEQLGRRLRIVGLDVAGIEFVGHGIVGHGIAGHGIVGHGIVDLGLIGLRLVIVIVVLRVVGIVGIVSIVGIVGIVGVVGIVIALATDDSAARSQQDSPLLIDLLVRGLALCNVLDSDGTEICSSEQLTWYSLSGFQAIRYCQSAPSKSDLVILLEFCSMLVSRS